MRSKSKQFPSKPLMVTIDRASQLAAVGRNTIYKCIANGSLKSVRVGRRRLINLASLERMLGISEPASLTHPAEERAVLSNEASRT
jgi:excisionase family DNA binding protein